MSLSALISNYSAFNEWANGKIVAWLKTQDTGLLYQTTPSSFSTIDYTLQHILRTQNFWFSFICERNVSSLNWAIRENEVSLVLNELNAVSTQMKESFCSFKEADLLYTLHLNMPWAKNDLSRYEYILHVINHSTFHRGQIITMARCLGINEGVVNTDYNIFNSR